MTFAVYALTPTALADGGALPANVPNPSYRPLVLYALTKMTPDFDLKDNASLALVQVKRPDGAVALEILSSEQVNGQIALIMPSEGIMPMRAIAYTPDTPALPQGIRAQVFAQGPAPVRS